MWLLRSVLWEWIEKVGGHGVEVVFLLWENE